MKKQTIYVFAFLACTFFISCESENIEVSTSENLQEKSLLKSDLAKKSTDQNIKKGKTLNYETIGFSENALRDFTLSKLVDASAPCGTTELSMAFGNAVAEILNDPYRFTEFGFLAVLLMNDINTVHAVYDEGTQSFGDRGQYTNYVNNEVRNLEKFWNMPNEVSVRGQHRSTLNNRQAIIDALEVAPWFWGTTFFADNKEYWADWIIANNELSAVLPESPLIASDGFAFAPPPGGLFGLNTPLIVIGDGLIELVYSVGTEDKIGWTTVLSHEWAHQVQFKYNYIEYWETIFPYEYEDIVIDEETTITIQLPNPELTRAIELEADYVAAYYMTHKKGATYNLKRIEQYLENFFQIGDCAFADDSHHGTPLQRMEASQLGNELAMSRKQRGKVLSAEEIHAAFVAVLDVIAPQPPLIEPK